MKSFRLLIYSRGASLLAIQQFTYKKPRALMRTVKRFCLHCALYYVYWIFLCKKVGIFHSQKRRKIYTWWKFDTCRKITWSLKETKTVFCTAQLVRLPLWIGNDWFQSIKRIPMEKCIEETSALCKSHIFIVWSSAFFYDLCCILSAFDIL